MNHVVHQPYYAKDGPCAGNLKKGYCAIGELGHFYPNLAGSAKVAQKRRLSLQSYDNMCAPTNTMCGQAFHICAQHADAVRLLKRPYGLARAVTHRPQSAASSLIVNFPFLKNALSDTTKQDSPLTSNR